MAQLLPSSLSPWRFSRFDRVVAITAVFALALVGLMIWQAGTEEDTAGILYLSWGEDFLNQIYLISDDDTPRSLSDEAADVLNFAVSPDGSTIVYALRREDGRSDLWSMATNGRSRRLLLACDDAACSQPRWSPDSQRIVYERRTVLEPNSPPGSPRLWWLDVSSSETVPVFSDTQWLGWGAAFSPNGRWLSYLSPVNQEIQAYNLETGNTVHIPSRSGEPAVWSPQSDTILVTDIQLSDDKFAVHIFAVDLDDNETINLSGEEADVNDSLPTWSPDGNLIAFSRKTPRVAEGKQVWIMAPDGSEAINLTQNPDVHFGTPSWSPDSNYLTFQGYKLSEPGAEPTIWRYDIAEQQLAELASPGIQPIWIP
ncbi:MAG: hypothetical protein AAF614_38460 [Chloroflexota bacterium]